MGLDVSLYYDDGNKGEDDDRKYIELPSTKYPDHNWKIGYFRSSYNDSGIDHILDLAGLPTLADIFNVGNEYLVKPDWNEAKDSALRLKERYTEYRAKTKGYALVRVDAPITTFNPKEILPNFIKAHQKDDGAYASYSCRDGDFFLGGLKIYAVYAGTGYFGKTDTYFVVKDESEEGDYYLQAIEIMIETIEYVLSQKDPEKYCLSWSG